MDLPEAQALEPVYSQEWRKTVYQCERCNKYYASKKSLSNHIRNTKCGLGLVSYEDRYTCEFCGSKYNYQRSLVSHMKDHLETETAASPAPMQANYLTCPIGQCEMKFSSQKILLEHLFCRHMNSETRCKKCKAPFASVQGLLAHFKEKHCGLKVESATTSADAAQNSLGELLNAMEASLTPESRDGGPSQELNKETDLQKSLLIESSALASANGWPQLSVDSQSSGTSGFPTRSRPFEEKPLTYLNIDSLPSSSSLTTMASTPAQLLSPFPGTPTTPAAYLQTSLGKLWNSLEAFLPPKINDGMPNQEFEKHADFQKNYGSSQFSGATLYDQGSVSSRLSEREFEYPRDLPTSSNVCEPANSSSSTRHQTLAGFNGVRPVNRQLKCEICEKQFANKPNLNRHRKIHSGTKSKKCHICQQTLHRENRLQEHLYTHLKERSHFDCPMLNCFTQFRSHLEIQRHLEHLHLVSPHNLAPCRKCRKHFGTAKYFLIHHYYYHSTDLIPPAPASTCSTRWSPKTVSTSESSSIANSSLPSSGFLETSRARLQAHSTSLPQDQLPQTSNKILGASPFLEGFCGQDSTVLLNTDQQLSPSLSPVEQSFSEPTSSEPTLSFECQHCKIQFDDAPMSLLHNTLHASGSPFKCSFCGAESEDNLAFTIYIVTANHNFSGL